MKLADKPNTQDADSQNKNQRFIYFGLESQ